MPGNNLFGITPSATGSLNASSLPAAAPKNLAALYLAEWNDYKQRFQPLETLRNSLLTPQFNQQEQQAVLGDVSSAYAKLPQQYTRLLLGYGQLPTAQQTASFSRQANLQKGLDQVTAFNQAALAEDTRAYGALGNFGSPNAALTGAGGQTQSGLPTGVAF